MAENEVVTITLLSDKAVPENLKKFCLDAFISTLSLRRFPGVVIFLNFVLSIEVRKTTF